MTSKKAKVWGTGLLLCSGLGVLFYFKVPFDWHSFWLQVRGVRMTSFIFAVSLIYLSVCLRAFRWAALLKPRKKVASLPLIGPQFIGFTCVALFGSLGDLVRPYLLARKVNLPLSSQIATYTIERMFDLAAAALIFSGALVATPRSAGLPNRHLFVRLGVGGLLATLAILLMATLIRRWGELPTVWLERNLETVSPRLAAGIAAKLRSFRDGLHTITSIWEFLQILIISLGIWGLVAIAYVQVVHSFVHTPELANLSVSLTMLLLAASIGGSLVQLPVLGWFTQIAATAATMHKVMGVPTEASTACGALLLAVTFILLIPAGLVFSQFEQLSFRTMLTNSEAAEAKV